MTRSRLFGKVFLAVCMLFSGCSGEITNYPSTTCGGCTFVPRVYFGSGKFDITISKYTTGYTKNPVAAGTAELSESGLKFEPAPDDAFESFEPFELTFVSREKPWEPQAEVNSQGQDEQASLMLRLLRYACQLGSKAYACKCPQSTDETGVLAQPSGAARLSFLGALDPKVINISATMSEYNPQLSDYNAATGFWIDIVLKSNGGSYFIEGRSAELASAD